MKRILFPTDFSENAHDALVYIFKLFEGQKIELKILHVVDPTSSIRDVPMSTIQIINLLSQKAEEGLKSVEKYANNYLDNANENWDVSTSILIGNPAIKIIEGAEEFNVDLIVLGNQGKNYSLSDKLLGVTSVNLTAEATCPVLLIPKSYAYNGLSTVLFPTNLEYSDPYILWKSMSPLKPHQPIIRCLHITSENNDSNLKEEKEFARFIEDHSPSIKTVFHSQNVDNQSIEEVILSFCENHNCQMLIMHKSKRSFLRKLFTKSLTQNIRRHIDRPLLIMNIKN